MYLLFLFKISVQVLIIGIIKYESYSIIIN